MKAPDAQAASGAFVVRPETFVDVVDLHTEYGPSMRFLRTEWLAAVVESEMVDAA